MILWHNLSTPERIASLQATSAEKEIEDRAVEKDWWVTLVLKSLFQTPCGPYLLFKGGTSLSKGWGLINRFSEDIDISLERRFFLEILGISYAAAANNTQLKNLRKASRDYIHDILSENLARELHAFGVDDFTIENVSTRKVENVQVPIDHDSDPTVILVKYQSLFPSYTGDILAQVKIEISCLSMSEPFEVRNIRSLISEKFPGVDDDSSSAIRTVTPDRTFLEKAFLLSEEFQKEHPRSKRMSRHLYDLERIMDTSYGQSAIKDTTLYKALVEHRRKFYHLGYVNYDADYPTGIHFVPSGETLDAFHRDYNENMVDGYIYGKAMPFEDLIARIALLQERFRSIPLEPQ